MSDDRLRMPGWYVRLCRRQSKAFWRGQITDQEATIALRVFHQAALTEALAAR